MSNTPGYHGHFPNDLERQSLYLTDELLDDFVGGGHRVTHSAFVTARAFYSGRHAASGGAVRLGRTKLDPARQAPTRLLMTGNQL